MYNLVIRPEVENFQMKIYYPAEIEPRTAEPEADMVPSEPARQAMSPNVIFLYNSDLIITNHAYHFILMMI